MIQKYFKPIGFLIMLASLAFIVDMLLKFDLSYLNQLNKFNFFSSIILSSLLYGIFFLLLPIGWMYILNILSPESAKVKTNKIIFLYAKSNLMKYLPGNVMEFIGRNIFGNQYGIKQYDLALSSVLETILIIASSVLVGLVFSSEMFFKIKSEFETRFSIHFHSEIFLVIIFLFGLAFLFLFYFKREKIKFEIKKILIKYNLKNALFKIFSVYVFHCILFIAFSFSLVLILVMNFEINLNFDNFKIITSAFCFSWILGFVTPGAPGGLGVKEAALFTLLSPFFSSEITLTATLIHRLVSILGDVVMLLLARLIDYFFTSKDI